MEARDHLERLVGQTVYTIARRNPNRILAVDGDSVVVGTDKSPSGERVPIRSVQDAIDQLRDKRELVISVKAVGYRSAFIGAVLSELPGVEIEAEPSRIRLTSTGGRRQIWGDLAGSMTPEFDEPLEDDEAHV